MSKRLINPLGRWRNWGSELFHTQSTVGWQHLDQNLGLPSPSSFYIFIYDSSTINIIHIYGILTVFVIIWYLCIQIETLDTICGNLGFGIVCLGNEGPGMWCGLMALVWWVFYNFQILEFQARAMHLAVRKTPWRHGLTEERALFKRAFQNI